MQPALECVLAVASRKQLATISCDQLPDEPVDPGPKTGRGGVAGVGCVTRSTNPDATPPSFVSPSRVSCATAVATTRDAGARRLRKRWSRFLHRGLLLRRFPLDVVHGLRDRLGDGFARFLRASARRAHTLGRAFGTRFAARFAARFAVRFTERFAETLRAPFLAVFRPRLWTVWAALREDLRFVAMVQLPRGGVMASR